MSTTVTSHAVMYDDEQQPKQPPINLYDDHQPSQRHQPQNTINHVLIDPQLTGIPLTHVPTFQSHVLYVGGLQWWITDADIRHIFDQFGTVLQVILHADKVNGKSKGYGYVEYASNELENACIAKKQLHGYIFKKCALIVTYANIDKLYVAQYSNNMLGRNQMNRNTNKNIINKSTNKQKIIQNVLQSQSTSNMMNNNSVLNMIANINQRNVMSNSNIYQNKNKNSRRPVRMVNNNVLGVNQNQRQLSMMANQQSFGNQPSLGQQFPATFNYPQLIASLFSKQQMQVQPQKMEQQSRHRNRSYSRSYSRSLSESRSRSRSHSYGKKYRKKRKTHHRRRYHERHEKNDGNEENEKKRKYRRHGKNHRRRHNDDRRKRSRSDFSESSNLSEHSGGNLNVKNDNEDDAMKSKDEQVISITNVTTL